VAERSALGAIAASRWLDPALAVTLTAVCLGELFTRPGMTDSPLAAVVVILVGGSVAVRRTHPVPAVSGDAALLLASAGFEGEFPPSTGAAVVFILSYSCGAHAALRPGLLAVAALLVSMQVAMGFAHFPDVEIGLFTLAPWWVGRQVRLRRGLVTQLGERTRELEAEQDAFARLSVRRERARIARELHDIVAHHLAVIVVQAGAGRLAGPNNGNEHAARFASIRQSGDQALTEMARLVDIIHADNGAADHGPDRLRTLFEQARAGGLTLDLTPLPADIELPPTVEEDAFRVVREALTNAMKHAPGARVHVRLALSDGSLEIDVRDHGGRAPSGLAQTGSGLGLTGMRERIQSLGGGLDAGPDDAGGWHLHARLPTSSREIADAR
jgi:signal transduction histidine kinase